jgi:putative oxidoreductase
VRFLLLLASVFATVEEPKPGPSLCRERARGVPVTYAGLALRLFLGAVFVLASLPKLGALDDFERAVVNYELLPRRVARPVAVGLPWLELLCGVALLVGLGPSITAATVAVCLVMFAAAAGYNLLRGRRMDCGCHGSAAPRTISWSLVVKDLALAGVAVFVAASPVTNAVLHWPGAAAPSASAGTAVSLYCIATIAALVEATGLELIDIAQLVFRLRKVEVPR